MTKIDIISGFLGAGKTTLIKKLIQEAFAGEKLVLIENEFGEIGIDGGFLKDAGIQITEMNSGCICCSLVGDFGEALNKVLEQFAPDRIIIEPSGVGKLSDVIKAVQRIEESQKDHVVLNSATTVVDAVKSKMYMKNFGEFFNNQVEAAGTIVLSRSQKLSEEKLQSCVEQLREDNATATIITTPWEELDGKQIVAAMESRTSFAQQLLEEEEICPVCGHHHEDGHHHDHDEECECGHDHHHHDHDEECECGHEHHHHDHDEECECGHEHHHHDHDEECECGHEHHHHDHDEECGCGHDHHHHHHADEVFTSWGVETPRKYTAAEVQMALDGLDENGAGVILRAKGILPGADGSWIHFDYVPGESQIRTGAADVTGRICVIGTKLDTDMISKLFQL